MKLSQNLRQHQSLALTPFLQKAIELLRMTHMEIIDVCRRK